MRGGFWRFFKQGSFAACGRRASFWVPRKKPKRHQGADSDGRLCAHIPPPPGPPFYGGRQLGKLGGQRKGAGGSADCVPLVFRYRSLGGNQELGTPLGGSAFVVVGLELCGGVRRAGLGPAPTVHRKPVGAHIMRPPAYGPGMIARKSQAQRWDRTGGNFCKPRAQWPGGNLDTHSNFARRKFC